MFRQYGLTLVVTHDCTMRCLYCYAGKKFAANMPFEMGQKATDRALASTEVGGRLELSFFGGEPLLRAGEILSWIEYAKFAAHARGVRVSISLTTNATLIDGDAGVVLRHPDVEVTVSHDGAPEAHDHHRVFADGTGSFTTVEKNLIQLMDWGKEVKVVMVVRPDTLNWAVRGILHLRRLGVRGIYPSLDVWANWTEQDEDRLEETIRVMADLWRDGLPNYALGWFDEKAVLVMGQKLPPSPRCGFGRGEIAVAPSGRMYPCERLVGDDRGDHPLILAGNVMEGEDFLNMPPANPRNDPACGSCQMAHACNTFCRCANFVRTGNVSRPDSLLCRWNQRVLQETARALSEWKK